MNRVLAATLALGLLAAGCGREPGPGVRLGEPAPPDTVPPPRRPGRSPGPLDRRASFAFHAVPFPKLIGTMERRYGLALGVSPAVPVERWAACKVTLRMADVSVRAFLDWLVRLLGAEYAVEEGGGVWVTRGDELLLGEPLCVRSYAVPPHFRTRRPVRGALSFVREQREILATLHECLGYLEARRKGCRLAFHGEQAVLVARLPPRGHLRLASLLDAMRYGTEPPGLPRPARHQLRASLRSAVACDWPPGPLASVLARVAEQARVNLGWDAARLGDPVVAVPKGSHTLKQVLDAVMRQTRLGRYELEPGHGIWLYLEGQDENLPDSGATLWDRALVRAFDIRPLLEQSTPEAILAHLRRQVDPGQWERGLPAASVFAPTRRLLVVHDADGQRRVASVVQQMLARALRPPDSRGRR